MNDPRSERVADLRAGQYADGSPLHDVQYLECKLILKTDEFTSPAGFRKYGKLVAQVAEECGIGFDQKPAKGARPAIREVMFLDTEDFRLYSNAFILRRRIRFEDGFPAEEPEVVFKFRHPDQQEAAEVDVRPNLPGDYRIKFKAEALPLKDRLGGYRLLFSHNVQFPLSHAPTDGDRTAMEQLMQVFPAMKVLQLDKGDHVSLVNQTIVEEVLQDLGTLDFGKGVTADANVALWRTRGEHLPLVGEFAYQVKFKRREEVHDKARERCARFFIRLQQVGHAWIYLGATKTGMVYRLKGNPPQAHE
ncbi:hypothetical protein [Variovorax saccharolyticus]|uniref:hypothetical protein n=1 Tax=Variovorax saccharolyticus TaxID=3053516 RepID=UPI0025788CED|nr:hypothetical protein [Variovorax sp. J22R187]MDM0019256.1 hypothetical protein [Variovorax sp. J22R187]